MCVFWFICHVLLIFHRSSNHHRNCYGSVLHATFWTAASCNIRTYFLNLFYTENVIFKCLMSYHTFFFLKIMSIYLYCWNKLKGWSLAISPPHIHIQPSFLASREGSIKMNSVWKVESAETSCQMPCWNEQHFTAVFKSAALCKSVSCRQQKQF